MNYFDFDNTIEGRVAQSLFGKESKLTRLLVSCPQLGTLVYCYRFLYIFLQVAFCAVALLFWKKVDFSHSLVLAQSNTTKSGRLSQLMWDCYKLSHYGPQQKQF